MRLSLPLATTVAIPADARFATTDAIAVLYESSASQKPSYVPPPMLMFTEAMRYVLRSEYTCRRAARMSQSSARAHGNDSNIPQSSVGWNTFSAMIFAAG